jgi:hypothetical protein
MNFALIATIAGLVLGILGVVPLLVAGAGSLLSLRRSSRILEFGRKTPLDVILTTSGRTQHPSGTSRSFRTNVGEVWGLGSLARALGRYYPGKPMRVHMSADIKNVLDGDVVVLGGPLLNDTAGDFIKEFNDKYKTNIVHYASGQQITVGEYSCDGYDLKRTDGVPDQDLALVLLARNLFSEHPSRDVLCAGFTTYGTAAATELLFSDLLSPKSRASAKPLRGADAAAIVAEFRMAGGQVTRWSILYSHVFSRAAAGPNLRALRRVRLPDLPGSRPPSISAAPEPGHPAAPEPTHPPAPEPSYPAAPERGTTSPDS